MSRSVALCAMRCTRLLAGEPAQPIKQAPITAGWYEALCGITVASKSALFIVPARVILFLPDVEWDCGMRRVDRPEGGVAPRPGPLSISARQIAAMREVRLRGFDARMAEVVRLKYFGGDHPDGNRLVDTVSRQRRQAEAFGVENEQHFIDFVEVMLIAGAHVIDEDDFRAIMHRPGWLMEEKCRRLRRRYLGN